MKALSLLKSKQILPIIICVIAYILFAYQLEREQFAFLFSLYSILFLGFILVLKFGNLTFKQLAYIAFGFRALFILAVPNLSQDFYRFIWDGRLILEGLNPYLQTPNTIMASGIIPIANAQELYKNMGELSAMHFSNYPPINQLYFFIAALFSSKSILGSVVVLRILIIIADLGVLYFGKRLLEHLKINPKQIFWYILNPFIIIELTGNLHFESVMVFFLISSLYYLFKNKWIIAAILLGCSISVKLIPLLFLPVFFWWFLKHKKSTEFTVVNFIKLISFYILVILTLVVSFLPFLSQELIANYSKTIGLWFGDFEFNASLYYVFREIGYWFRGYNEIKIIGKLIPILVILFTLLITFLRKNQQPKTLITSLLLALSFYLFTATTVHPWYIATVLILSVFTTYNYVIVWSFIVVLSYYTYSQIDFKENILLLFIQYILVYSVFFWDVFFNRKLKNSIK
ncbi:polyprenol phosphomannose-dependent alpha 1,6 mannosyltransferase MptB [Aurantibacter sp.]|uniref:polyprenol phosphomannose-dependent alpha 1,6 mannosyltransferase MptB n=1 Tax=Aurantibacter sp. TaxID=2807103 RepID=UPI0035C807A7